MNNSISRINKISPDAGNGLTKSVVLALAVFGVSITAPFADETTEHGMAGGAMGHGTTAADAVIAGFDLINSAGFHGMEDEIEAAQTMDDVNAGNLGRVEDALTIIRAVDWPEELAELVHHIEDNLRRLANALSAGNLQGAQAEVAEIHHTQHEFSEGVYGWLEAHPHNAMDGGAVMAVIDIVNTSGFHGMEQEIEAAQSMAEVSSRNLGTVQNALTMVRAVDWEADLTESMHHFEDLAQALADALAAGDLAAAKAAVAEIHHGQHELSEGAYQWLGGQAGSATGKGAVMAGIDLINSSGFHGMQEEIEAAQAMDDVSASHQIRAENALAVVRAVNWPAELDEPVHHFEESTQALADALAAGNLQAAKTASSEIHHTQHEFSEAVYQWLAPRPEGIEGADAMIAGVDMINTTGFHGMQEEIEAAQTMDDVSSRNLGKVENALTIIRAVDWPEELAEVVHHIEDNLQLLADALSAEDLPGAKGAVAEIHHTQHDFSEGVYGWLEAHPESAVSGGAIMAVIDVVNTSGFHGMEEEIAAAQSMDEVSSRNLGIVQNALTAVRAVAWEANLTEPVHHFEDIAQALADALAAGDLAAAKAAVAGIHHGQHELSEGAYQWLGDHAGAATGKGAVLASIDLVNTSGFHGMQEEIEAAQTMDDVNSRNLGTVQKALTSVKAVNWPAEVDEPVHHFEESTQALADALAAGDLQAAKTASSEIHHTQHEFSNAVYQWLGSGLVDHRHDAILQVVGFGVNGGLELELLAEDGQIFEILASDNILDWVSLGTITIQGGAARLTDENASNFTSRFYKGVESIPVQ